MEVVWVWNQDAFWAPSRYGTVGMYHQEEDPWQARERTSFSWLDFPLEELEKLGRGCLGASVWTAVPTNTTGKSSWKWMDGILQYCSSEIVLKIPVNTRFPCHYLMTNTMFLSRMQDSNRRSWLKAAALMLEIILHVYRKPNWKQGIINKELKPKN